MNYHDAKRFARALDAGLQANDVRFGRSVTLVHDEGTVLHFESAFVIKRENYYFIFTEHHNTHVYVEDDVLKVIQRGRYIPIEAYGPK